MYLIYIQLCKEKYHALSFMKHEVLNYVKSVVRKNLKRMLIQILTNY